jgi:site-specific DNA-cytosine methylase
MMPVASDNCSIPTDHAAEDSKLQLQLFPVQAKASKPMRQQLLEYREAFTLQDAQQWCIACCLVAAFSFASLGCGACIGLMGVLRSKLWRPRWAAEAVAVKNAMWTAITNTPAFMDVVMIRVTQALWCHMIEVTMPCIDYSSSGMHRGEAGDTGWLWPYAIRLAIAIGPTIIFSEMADYALRLDGGRTVKRIVAALQVSYAVVFRIVKVWGYGDGSSRRRLIIVAVRKSAQGADDYEMPEPVYTASNPHTARDTAVPDSEVPLDHWRKEPLKIFYPKDDAKPGVMQKIGRLKPNMGHSTNPHLAITMDGTNNGPTTFGGGGTKPSLDWSWGPNLWAASLVWRRLTTVTEYYMIASLSKTMQAFHATFCPAGSDMTHFLRDCVNQGWPAGSAYHLSLSIAQFLRQQVQQRAIKVTPLSAQQQTSLTVAATDCQPSHVVLADDGVFHDCVLLKQPTPRTAKVLMHDEATVVQARRLWPWVPEMRDVTVPVTLAAGEEQLMHAAEVCFAQMCAPRGSNVQPTHMYLNSVNQWCSCTLIEMISFQWCAVATRAHTCQQVPTDLMAEFDVAVVGKHITHPASRKLFAAPQLQPEDDKDFGDDPEEVAVSNAAFGSFNLRKELFAAMAQPRGGRKVQPRQPTTAAQRAAASMPTEQECLAILTAFPDKDWAVPMHPNLSNKKVRQLLTGMIRRSEWAQMHHFLCMLNEVELESGTCRVYNDGVRHFLDFLERYPLEQRYTEAHRATGAVFEPAVWSPREVEAILIDFVLHEAAVRGNGWSGVRGKLFGIRHLNIRANLGNPLAGKYRLDQVMRALRKYNGPGEGKRPTSLAMILALERILDYENNPVEQVLLAAALTSWHFMMRSCEYCAKLPKGRFDHDRVLRFKDVKFYHKGRLTTNYSTADEVRVTFGKTKTTAGGEVRSHFATQHSCCVVKALAALFKARGSGDEDAPLFAWPKGSDKRGEGVRYIDMVELIKSAARYCGLDPSLYSSHSQRRGGASQYLLSGAMTLEECRIFGRWKTLSSLKLYIEPGAGRLAMGGQTKVLSGKVDVDMMQMEPPRERDVMRLRANKAARRMREAVTH